MRQRRLELFEAQHDFVACQERFTAFVGGIGSGKSFAGAVKGLSLCKPRTIGLVVTPTYPMLRDATLRSYQAVAGDLLTVRRTEMLGQFNSGEIFFRSADQPDHLRGPNVHWAHIDEAGLCPAGTWEIVIGRLRADGKAGPCFITTTPKGRNWLYERQAEMTLFRAKTQDNPYLAAEFVTSLESAYTGKFAAQELAGEFVGFEGLVYDTFNRAVHVQERAGPWTQVVIGVDEGYTNPAVLLPTGLDVDGRAHVLSEFYQRRVLQGAVVAEAQRLIELYRDAVFVVDPSAAGLIADLRESDLTVMPADNALFTGIQRLHGRLAVATDGQPRLTIAPACVNTLAEFESYVWRGGKAGPKDMPEKINDHAMDALRYAIAYADTGDNRRAGVWGRR